jgi:cytochrome bd-type quinol oxidase subunit 2
MTGRNWVWLVVAAFVLTASAMVVPHFAAGAVVHNHWPRPVRVPPHLPQVRRWRGHVVAPPTVVAEAPWAVLVPVVALVMFGVVVWRRQRSRKACAM